MTYKNLYLTSQQKDICEIIYKHGGYIAGGFAVMLAGGIDKTQDIDCYFKTPVDLLDALDGIYAKYHKTTPIYETNFGVSILPISGAHSEAYPISLNAYSFNVPDDMIETFDLGLARVYLLPNGDSVQPSLASLYRTNFVRDDAITDYTRERLEKYTLRIRPAWRSLLAATWREFTLKPKSPPKPQYPKVDTAVENCIRSIINQSSTTHTPTKVQTQVSCEHKNIKTYDDGMTQKFDYCTDCGHEFH